MRLAFLGAPDAAVPTLRALVDAGHDVVVVVSGPDRRRGRGGRATPTPVKAAAMELGLDVTDDLGSVTSAGAELGVVVAFGRIIPASILDEVPMINLHFSLLPRWRGAAPVERAILAGDDRTGVCVMDVAEGLDTGAIHAVAEVPLDGDITAADLTARLARLGATLVVDVLDRGLDAGTPQPDLGVTYAHKITTEDRRLDWSLSAAALRRIVRIGGAWTTFRGERLKVLDASVLDGSADASAAHGTISGEDLVVCGSATTLRLVTVQPAGRAPMDASAWARGAHPVGERLGDGSDPGA